MLTLQEIDWHLTKGDVCVAKKSKTITTTKTNASSTSQPSIGWKIYQRFHFSSALKRMSVIAGHTKPGQLETNYIATCKGAPEILKKMVF